jgi:hypothetical protein
MVDSEGIMKSLLLICLVVVLTLGRISHAGDSPPDSKPPASVLVIPLNGVEGRIDHF